MNDRNHSLGALSVLFSSNVFTLLIWMAIFAFPLQAQFSPGPLSRYHADLEGRNNCTQCHVLGERKLSDGCLVCHSPLRDRIEAGKGFHADKSDQCGTCHSDHNGVKFELVYWPKNIREFDHDKTGYSLTGSHMDLKCGKCHTRENIQGESILRWAEAWKEYPVLDRTFLGLDETCLSCHVDIHGDEVADDCETCHNTADWKESGSEFDHKRARFILTGAHKKVACEKCHPLQKRKTKRVWKLTGMAFDQCGQCHEDQHKGAFGATCETCHSTRNWKKDLKPFDHAKTRYPLVGKHEQIVCANCHTPELSGKLPVYDECLDCHEDLHRGEFLRSPGGGDCGRCHTVYGFLPSHYSLAMHQQTEFALDGSHLAIPCIACHKKTDPLANGTFRQFHFESTACQSCHTDEHRDQFRAGHGNQCQDCHSTTSFLTARFDHNESNFPLDGKHISVACDKCHGNEQDARGSFRRYVPVPHTCSDCHSLTGEIR